MPRLQCDQRQQNGTGHIQIVAESELKDASDSLHKGQRLDRRNDVSNEALAEEVRRAEQRKRREDDEAKQCFY